MAWIGGGRVSAEKGETNADAVSYEYIDMKIDVNECNLITMHKIDSASR